MKQRKRERDPSASGSQQEPSDKHPLNLSAIVDALWHHIDREVTASLANQDDKDEEDHHTSTETLRHCVAIPDTTMGRRDPPKFLSMKDDFPYLLLCPSQYAQLLQTRDVVLQRRWPPAKRGAAADYHMTVQVHGAEMEVMEHDDCNCEGPSEISLSLRTSVSFTRGYFYGRHECQVRKAMPLGDKRILCSNEETGVECAKCLAPIGCSKCKLIEPDVPKLCKHCTARK